jgi:hypothetical protein
MQIRNNRGELIGEINTIIRPGEGVIISNTVYSGDRVISQTITSHDNQGSVKTETNYGGKLIP